MGKKLLISSELHFNPFPFAVQKKNVSRTSIIERERDFNFDYESLFAAHLPATWLD
jgi:hypothetical protein